MKRYWASKKSADQAAELLAHSRYIELAIAQDKWRAEHPGEEPNQKYFDIELMLAKNLDNAAKSLLAAHNDLEIKLFFDKRTKFFHSITRKPATSPTVQIAPGCSFAKICQFILSKKKYDLYVRPHLADMHHEFFEALSKGEEAKAQWVRIRFYITIFWPIVRAIFAFATAINKMFSKS